MADENAETVESGLVSKLLDDDLVVKTEEKPIEEIKPSEEEKPAVIEEVKTEEKPAEENQENKPADITSTNWLTEVAKISNNEINSEDGLKAIIENAKKYVTLESEHTELKTKFDEAERTKPKFASEYMKTLNELELSGDKEKVKLFIKINSIGDIKDLSSYDAESIRLQWLHNLTPEEAEIKMKSTYKLDEQLHGEDAVAESKVDLKIKGEEAKKWIAEQQKSIEVTSREEVQTPKEPTEAELKAKYDEAVVKVAPLVKTIEQELPTYFKGINTNGLKDDKAITNDFPVPDDVLKQVVDATQHHAAQFGLDSAKAEHVEHLKQFAKNTAKFLMYDAHIIDAANKREEKVRAEFVNPSNIDRGKNNPNAPEKTGTEQAASFVANNL